MKNFKIFFLLISLLLCFGGTIKADIIHISMPGGVQNLCQSSGFDTFIFHKPLGFGSTMWYINGITQGSGDSLIFIPTAMGSFTISSTWNGNGESCILHLFGAPPAHIDFILNPPSGSGFLNSTNDTIWMCAPSIFVGSNGDGNEVTAWHWSGATTGFYSVDPAVTITDPDKYYLYRENPCGITVDSIVVIRLPVILPVFTDTSFCNVPVSITLDPGPGWNYSWTPGGATTQTLFVNTAGTYTVNLTNLCASGSATINVDHQSFPQPDLWYLQGLPMCADSVLVLDPSPGYTYDSYIWSNGLTTPTISISGLTTGGGMFFVTVTQGGCTASVYGEFQFYQQPVTPEICIVTVDPAVNKNKVVWTNVSEPMGTVYSPTTTYNVYKWAGGSTWILLGNTPVGQDHVFTDITSNPPAVSARYKITMVDNCGVESLKSYYHKTMHLSTSDGSMPGDVNLDWGSDGGYMDESGNFVVDQYQIWRGNHPDSLTFYVQTPFSAYTDQNVFTQKYYQIVVTKLGGCDPSPAKTLITGSSSNVSNNTITNITDQSLSDVSFSIYPNPSTGIFHIEGPISLVEIRDNIGRVIMTTTQSTIDLAAYSSGIYFATIHHTKGSTNCKLIVQ